MNSMNCFECVLKHLAGALSYGKEILSGHSKGAELDHRIDFLGEIKNAEDHLELIDKKLFDEISLYRKEIQSKDVLINSNDLDFLRGLYLKVEKIKNGEKDEQYKPEPLKENPDLIYLEVSNKEFFDLSHHLITSHLKNYSKIYVLKSSIDLSEYKDVILVDQNLREFMKRDDLSKDVLILKENMGILKDYDAKEVFPTFLGNIDKSTKEKIPLNYDGLKLQPVNVEKFNELIQKDEEHPLSVYFHLLNREKGLDDTITTVNVDKKVCCSIRSGIKIKKFVRWNEIALESLKKELGIK